MKHIQLSYATFLHMGVECIQDLHMQILSLVLSRFIKYVFLVVQNFPKYNISIQKPHENINRPHELYAAVNSCLDRT